MLVVMVGRNFEKMLVDNSVLLITELGLGLVDMFVVDMWWLPKISYSLFIHDAAEVNCNLSDMQFLIKALSHRRRSQPLTQPS